jgi:hypothetical protein
MLKARGVILRQPVWKELVKRSRLQNVAGQNVRSNLARFLK